MKQQLPLLADGLQTHVCVAAAPTHFRFFPFSLLLFFLLLLHSGCLAEENVAASPTGKRRRGHRGKKKDTFSLIGRLNDGDRGG